MIPESEFPRRLDRAKAVALSRYKSLAYGVFGPSAALAILYRGPKPQVLPFSHRMLPFDYTSQVSKQTDGNFIT